MFIDLTCTMDSQILKKLGHDFDSLGGGHVGSHFDAWTGIAFPLEYCVRKGLVFDCSKAGDLIKPEDVDLSLVEKDMFVAFYTGFGDNYPFGIDPFDHYYLQSPELSKELLDELIKKGISLIGIDFGGVQRGDDHYPMDVYCERKGVYIIENLHNIGLICQNNQYFTAYTFPVAYPHLSGLPCRVVAGLEE